MSKLILSGGSERMVQKECITHRTVDHAIQYMSQELALNKKYVSKNESPGGGGDKESQKTKKGSAYHEVATLLESIAGKIGTVAMVVLVQDLAEMRIASCHDNRNHQAFAPLLCFDGFA